MRPFYSMLIAHSAASYATLVADFAMLDGMGEVNPIVLVLYPVLQLFVIPYYLAESMMGRFEGRVGVVCFVYAVTVVITYMTLRKIGRRHKTTDGAAEPPDISN